VSLATGSSALGVSLQSDFSSSDDNITLKELTNDIK
jgi:hypothetical protein